MKCPKCGSNIVLSYITPTKIYRVDEDNKISRNDACVGPDYDEPYLDFHCSNDNEHVLGTPEINQWADQISELFYDTVALT